MPFFNFIAEPVVAGGGSDPSFSSVTFLSGFEGADGSTSFTDESASANAILANGNAQIDTAQFKFGASSLLCDGSGDYLQVGGPSDADFENASNTSPFCIEGFIRWNTTPADFWWISYYDGVSGWLFGWISGSMRFFTSVGPVNVTGGTTWSPVVNTWYHVAVDFDGTKVRVFADGVMKESMVTTCKITSNSGRFSIAGGQFTGSLNGWMDEVRFTKASRYGSDVSFTPPAAAFPRS